MTAAIFAFALVNFTDDVHDWELISRHPAYVVTDSSIPVTGISDFGKLPNSTFDVTIQIQDPDLAVDLDNMIGGIYPARYEQRFSLSLESYTPSSDPGDPIYSCDILSTNHTFDPGVMTPSPMPTNSDIAQLVVGTTLSGAQGDVYKMTFKTPQVPTGLSQITCRNYFHITDPGTPELISDTMELDPDTNTYSQSPGTWIVFTLVRTPPPNNGS